MYTTGKKTRGVGKLVNKDRFNKSFERPLRKFGRYEFGMKFLNQVTEIQSMEMDNKLIGKHSNQSKMYRIIGHMQ